MKSNKIRNYIFLYLAFLLFSLTSIMNKLASRCDFFSFSFFLFYGFGILISMIYAILWQKILMRFDLMVAYANQPIVTILGVVWGILFFQETLTWNMILGAGVIFLGVRLVVSDHES